MSQWTPFPATDHPLLEASGLEVRIGTTLVCRGLELRLEAGDCLGLLGRNGVGKTSLLHSLAGLRPIAAGAIRLQGTPLGQLRRRRIAQLLGLLPQEDYQPFPARVLETALTGRHPHIPAWRWEDQEDLRQARRALAQVGLAELETRRVESLSGGERRRLALARLLTQDPRIVLADEPTQHLDLPFQLQTLGWLRQRSEAGGGVILALHDPNLARRFCTALLLLFGEGHWLRCSIDHPGLRAHLERLYGHPLIELQGPRHPYWLPA